MQKSTSVSELECLQHQQTVNPSPTKVGIYSLANAL
jgi:hypothetical protein